MTNLLELQAQIAHHKDLYYNQGRPEISDAEYDELVAQLEEVEPLGAPSHKADTEHFIPMLSIQKVTTEEGLREWDRKLRARLRGAEADSIDYSLEPKIDGLSLSLVYTHGVLTSAVTRGTGLVGQNVYQNARRIFSIPLTIKDISPRVEIRGEVCMTRKNFERVNEDLPEKDRYTSPRNLATGTLLGNNPDLCASRGLQFVAYQLLNPSSLIFQTSVLTELSSLGFGTPCAGALRGCMEYLVPFLEKYERSRASVFPYDIDGMVFKVDKLHLQTELGATDHHPHWSIAYKFENESATTTLNRVDWQVGKSGVLTPVAILEPVKVGDSTVSRATLHNIDFINEKGIYPGCTVTVERAGDVIPYISKVNNPIKGVGLVIPTVCPVCRNTVHKETNDHQIYCTNVSCSAQKIARLEHLGSRDAFDIEGLGEENCKKIVEGGLVPTLSDLFRTTPQLLKEVDIKGRNALKLHAAIQAAKTPSLARFIYALCIPGVGTGIAENLALAAKTLDNLKVLRPVGLALIPGVGMVRAQAIYNFFQQSTTKILLHGFETVGVVPQGVTAVPPQVTHNVVTATGYTYVVTGALDMGTRDDIWRAIRDAGGIVGTAITRGTDYVVVGRKPSQNKVARANRLEIPIISEAQFREHLTS